MINNEKLVMTVEEAGRKLGISRPTAYKLVRTGQIPVLQLGHKLVVPIVALNRMLESCGTCKTTAGSGK